MAHSNGTHLVLMDYIGHTHTVTIEGLEEQAEYFQREVTKEEHRVSPNANTIAWLQEKLRLVLEDLEDALEELEDLED